MFEQYHFANPEFLWLMLVIVPIVAWYVLREKDSRATIMLSTLQGLKKAPTTWKVWGRHSLLVFRVLAIVALSLVLARPQSQNNWENRTTEGIDIVLSLDISSSMLAQDFKPNRLEAAKDIAIEFVTGRRDDRIGLVLFSGESFTQCPLTTDHAVLVNLFKDIKSGMIEDGTAIGMGLANAVARLKDSKAKSRVIIILTDGENNRGEISPTTAAEIAHTFGIRVYTIGIGTIGTAPYPFQTPFGVQYQDIEVKIDEPQLKEIARVTDGKYFRATSNQKLKDIYKEIDKLEKTKIEVTEYSRRNEEYFWFAVAAVGFIFLEVLLKNTIFKIIP